MSDVLSAEAMRELDQAFAQEYGTTGTRDVYSMWHRVMRSHEQMRDERDAAKRRLAEETEARHSVIEHRDKLAAAARAGGCAADALQRIANETYPKGYSREHCMAIARDAIAAYDRAVSGQTAEKEEA